MKNILKKLHIVPGQPDDGDPAAAAAANSSSSATASPVKPLPRVALPHPELKPLSGLTTWLSSVTSRHSHSPPPPPSQPSSPPQLSSTSSTSSFSGAPRAEQMDGPGTGSSVDSLTTPAAAASAAASDVVVDAARRDSESSRRTEADLDEDSQIQLALELSAREDPEAVQIEVVKQISLGSCDPENSPAEILAYRYWNYNDLSYDDKILDGFYDLYGIPIDSTSMKMPSLFDLRGIPISEGTSWEAVLVNKAEDSGLLKLEQKALKVALKQKEESNDSSGAILVQKIANLVADYMGGKVSDPESMLEPYQKLRASFQNIVLPLGRVTIGLARHRALLFKVLADTLGIPCRLVKGKQFTGSDDGALGIVKLNNGREYMADLMSEPGILIPLDGGTMASESEGIIGVVYPFRKEAIDFVITSSSDEMLSSDGYMPKYEQFDMRPVSSYMINDLTIEENNRLHSDQMVSSEPLHKDLSERVELSDDSRNLGTHVHQKNLKFAGRSTQPYKIARSPSWTEGFSSPAVLKMKVKDVSQYMINAAKENPQLAQKLHDVLLESGVVAPPDLFSEIGSVESEVPEDRNHKINEDKDEKNLKKNELKSETESDGTHGPVLPHLPGRKGQHKMVLSRLQEPLKPVDGLQLSHPLNIQEPAGNSSSETSNSHLPDKHLQLIKHIPVAAAAATAAVVASSMVVAAAKSSTDMNLEVPVAAAATATAAAVVATTAAVSRQYENLDPFAAINLGSDDDMNSTHKNEEQQQSSGEGQGGFLKEQDASESHQIVERTSDTSIGSESIKSENTLDDVAEYEIPWEDIILGERIGLGSFGEVYRGDWHGTEVAVKRFLHQDISSEALAEFISEVSIMKRARHPNVVLFMGAVTKVPNLSIVTEFLPRGSLFRLIHRPNVQIDERRRLKLALDVARGMNYMHNCSPMIVHRDLKSPNLLVDKNWVVKICDFGLSRMKHSTFLSSRSTAGTAEWMAPEVLRNDPSDEKCDVYSYGVILWELCTLQQPWEGMNPMQVVGAVGFQDRRLDIPNDLDPIIADIIRKCWQTDPKLRPSFSEIMAALKPLQKPVSSNLSLRAKS